MTGRPPPAERICVGVIAAPHGVKGQVRVRSYTEQPDAIVDYGELTDVSGSRNFRLTVHGAGPKGTLICRIDGVDDRDDAAALRGQELYIERARLPATQDADSFYHADLIGLAVEAADGTPLGEVVDVHRFGGGDVLEVGHRAGETVMVPFTHAHVPSVDIAAGRIVAEVPQGVLPGDDDKDDGEGTDSAKDREGS